MTDYYDGPRQGIANCLSRPSSTEHVSARQRESAYLIAPAVSLLVESEARVPLFLDLGREGRTPRGTCAGAQRASPVAFRRE